MFSWLEVLPLGYLNVYCQNQFQYGFEVPNDIDVFVLLPSVDFEDLVGHFLQLNSSCCSRDVTRKHDMINVQMDGPAISFIRVRGT